MKLHLALVLAIASGLVSVLESSLTTNPLDANNDQQRDLATPGTQYCHKDNNNKFQSYTFYQGDPTGPCHCKSLCDHKACFKDYKVSSDGLTCTCIRNAVLKCGNHTECVADDCQCLPGYVGDAYEGCKKFKVCNLLCIIHSHCENGECVCDSGYKKNETSGCTKV